MRYLKLQFIVCFLLSLAFLPTIVSQTVYGYSDYISKAILIPNTEGYLIKEGGEVRSVIDGRLITKSLHHIDNSISDPVSIAKSYIKSQCHDLGLCGLIDNLFENNRIDTLKGGFIISFNVRHFNHLVENGSVRIKVNRKGTVRYVENYVPPTLTSLEQLKEYSSELKVLDHLVFNHFNGFTDIVINDISQVYKFDGANVVPAWRYTIRDLNTNLSFGAYIDDESEKLFLVECETNRLSGTAAVYNPNPIWSAAVSYGDYSCFDNNEDQTSDCLDDQLVTVELEDITLINNKYRLDGPNASIVDQSGNVDPFYDSIDDDFSTTRDQIGFEAANCYYHVDRSMRYTQSLGYSYRPYQYSTGVKIIPWQPNMEGGYYHRNSGIIELGDGSKLDSNGIKVGDYPDQGEDAAVIFHEIGHGIHNWAVNNQYTAYLQGIDEGIAEYWNLSNTRICECVECHGDWTSEYKDVWHWHGMDRLVGKYTLDYQEDYCTELFEDPYGEYIYAQYFYTALMRIYHDIGKYKTDIMFLEALPFFTRSPYPNIDQRDAAKLMYEAAEDLDFEDNDLCIIYNHFDDMFCFSGPPTNVVPPTSNSNGDYYMRDDKCDAGIELNANDDIWNSPDIWIRHNQDGLLEHQEPKYGENPNYVHVRIKGNSCQSVTDAVLRLYYSSTSTNLLWPVHFNNYTAFVPQYCCTGASLSGDEITTVPISIPQIEPGEEIILSYPWNIPVLPNSQGAGFVLLARIESSEDLMNTAEVSNVFANVKNNNNVAMKTIQALHSVAPSSLVKESSFWINVTNGSNLYVKSPNSQSLDYWLNKYDIFLELELSLYQEWVNSGRPGNYFSEKAPGLIQINSEDFFIDFSFNRQYPSLIKLKVSESNVLPGDQNRILIDVVCNEGIGDSGHGIRFHMDEVPYSEHRIAKENSDESSDELFLFPAVASHHISIRANNLNNSRCVLVSSKGVSYELESFDHEYIIEGECRLDIQALAPGFYIVTVINIESGLFTTASFIKI